MATGWICATAGIANEKAARNAQPHGRIVGYMP
jgi:hypothetical protein